MPEQAYSDADCYREKCDLVARNHDYWDPIHRRGRIHADFVLKGQHYEDDDDDTNTSRDSQMVRFVGQETFHVYRHEIADVSASPMSTSARPLDEYGDAETGELGVALLDAETEDPNKEFAEAIEDALGCAIVTGYGASRLSFDPEEGPWGELMVLNVAHDCFMWDPTVKSVHSKRCRWVIEKFRLTRAEMRRMPKWDKKVIDAMVPGRQSLRTSTKDTDGQARLGQSNTSATFNDNDEFWVYLVWERRPERTKKRPKLGSYVTLDQQDRYLSCTECGFRGKSQGELEHELPEVGSNCPTCEANGVEHPLMRMDAEEVVEELLAYPDGLLTVVAPDCGVEKAVYTGKWPFKARSYPYYHIQRFRDPMNTVGPSIAGLNWWNQLALDLHFRIALERQMQSQPYWLLPEYGLNDDVGERFEMSDEQGNQMYYEGESPPTVTLIEGAGIPSSWSVMHQALYAGLTTHTGIADFGFGPKQSRDIAAKSLEVQVEQQEIPTAHFKRRHHRELSRFLGVYFDAIRDTYPDARIVRLRGPDGVDAVKRLRAADLPNFDFVVTSAPDFTGLDQRKAAAFETMLGVLEARPWAFDEMVKVNKLSPSVARGLKAAFKQYQQGQAALAQQQAAAQRMAMGGGQPGMPSAPMETPAGPAAPAQPLADSAGAPESGYGDMGDEGVGSASASIEQLLQQMGMRQAA